MILLLNFEIHISKEGKYFKYNNVNTDNNHFNKVLIQLISVKWVMDITSWTYGKLL